VTNTHQPAAGWYPDPSGAPNRRYWDGQSWTDHFADGAWAPPLTIDRHRDLEDLRASGRRAKIAVLVGVPVYAASPALQGAQVRESRKAIRDMLDQLEALESQSPGTPGVRVEPYGPAPISTLSSALSLPNLVIGVLFVIWFHKAATIAARMGRPARRTTGWAVGGWLIPIGNFFLPYQSACDFFRPGEARRSSAKHWWLAYIVAIGINVPLGVLAGFSEDTEVALAAGALALVLWLHAAHRAQAFIEAASASLSDGL
jgi:hypothetical protein